MTNTNASINTYLINHPQGYAISQKPESLLDRIVAQLIKISKSITVGEHAVQQHKSFIEENLLDPRMGPEISRILR